MSKVLVKWNKSNVMSVGAGLPDASVIQFMPGVNEFTKEQWETVSKHPEIKKRMETEVVDLKRGKVPMIEVLSEAKKADDSNKGDDDNNEGGIAGLNVGDAKALVKETENTPLLREWLESETRKGVKEAIEKKLEKIEADREGSNDENNSQE
jgi:hypothetical protein